MKKTAYQKLSQVMEDYLETIFVLSKDKGYARTGEIAKSLKVSPSSVVEMIGKISKLGYVEWRRYEGVFLSPEGKMRGEVIHIRHETLRKFFEFIGVDPGIANKEACIIEHELSPITTSAIGNLVSFLNTPAGLQTISALNLFVKIQNAGLPWESQVIIKETEFNQTNITSTIRSQVNTDIISVITSHDLLNTTSSLLRYLELLKTMSSGNEMDLVICRIEATIQSINRQISTSSNNLLPGFSEPKWMNLTEVFNNTIKMLDMDSVEIEHNLDIIAVYGDPLLEKAVYYILESSIRNGNSVSQILSGYRLRSGSLLWYIQDNGLGIPEEEKKIMFNALTEKNNGKYLYIAYQILKTCGFDIREVGKPGDGAKFEISIPNGLYQIREKYVDAEKIINNEYLQIQEKKPSPYLA